ncbi:MAG: ATP-dependent metallopeptidase FtsH/Yme1/Tma family protein, partial [Rickettsiales bacterium]
MPNFGKNIFVWIILIVLLVALFKIIDDNSEHSGFNKLVFSDFLEKTEAGQVADVTMRTGSAKGASVTGHLSDGTPFSTQTPDYPNLIDILTAKNVKITATTDEGKESLLSIL